MTEHCQRCKEKDEDRRTLWISCFYDMNELDIPFDNKMPIDLGGRSNYKFYTLRICKDCRADWLRIIQNWFKEEIIQKEKIGSGIFIREFGSLREVTLEEFNKKYRNKKNE